MTATSYRKVARALTRLGFEVLRQRGSHVIWRHSDGRMTVVPNHSSEDIGPGLLSRIARDLQMTFQELLEKL